MRVESKKKIIEQRGSNLLFEDQIKRKRQRERERERKKEREREIEVFEEEKMEENTKKYKKMEKGVGFCKARSLVNLVVIRLSTQ